jgi:membrane protein DedA with SNARE-associated domain
MLAFLSLMLGTLVSEDLACIAAGLLIQRGQIAPASAVGACTLGIFAGDVGLWAAGRLCARAPLVRHWSERWLTPSRLADSSAWLHRHAGRAILASRFLPGARLPLYVVSGLLGLPVMAFAGWALLGALLWTPSLVLLTAVLGDTFVARVSPALGAGWLVQGVAVATMALILRALRAAASPSA